MRRIVVGIGLILTVAISAVGYSDAQDSTVLRQDQLVCDAASTPGATPELAEDVSAGAAATPNATLEALAATAVTLACETPEATPIG